jgi:hypothetical protein
VSESRWKPGPEKGSVVGDARGTREERTMQPTGDRAGKMLGDATWQPPLEADPADVIDQERGVADEADPEAAVSGARPDRTDDLDLLSRASEADLAEQFAEVPFDDDADR